MCPRHPLGVSMRTTSLGISILAFVGVSLATGCKNELTGLKPTPPQDASRAIATGIVLFPPWRWTQFVEITAGYAHTCARQYGGDLYCWGSNGLGQIGLGESDPLGQPTPTPCASGAPCVTAPTLVMGGVSQVTAGDAHTCAINTSADAYCWGNMWAGITAHWPYDQP